MQNAKIFEAASTVALHLTQSIISPPKRKCGEEILWVFEKSESARFANKGPDDMPVIDTVASSTRELFVVSENGNRDRGYLVESW